MELYNSMWNVCPYFNTEKEAHIKVLPRKDKDPLEPASHRPISLGNFDSKILSKIIANRLAPLIPSLINPFANRLYCRMIGCSQY